MDIFKLLYMRIFIGIIMIVLGTVLILKTPWFVQNFGSSAWAESKFGLSGGTRLMYKVVGLIFIFFGALLATNLIGGFLMATIGKIFIPQ